MANKNLRKLFRQHVSNTIDSHVDDKELFTSAAFKEYMRSLIISLTHSPCTLHLWYDPEDRTTAYTDGNTIYVNAGHGMSRDLLTQNQRALAIAGLVSHECAHKIYLDFGMMREVENAVMNGMLYGSNPVAGKLSTLDKEVLKNMSRAIQDPRQQKIFLYVYHQIDNIIADAHDEACLCRDFGGIVPQGIMILEQHLKSRMLSFEALMASGNQELSNIFNLMLSLARYDSIFALNEKEAQEHDVVKSLMKVKPFIKLAREEDDYEIRSSYINRCILFLWGYIQKIMDQMNNSAAQGQGGEGKGDSSGTQQSGDGGESSPMPSEIAIGAGTGNEGEPFVPTDEMIDKIMDQLEKGALQTSQAPTNQPRTSPVQNNAANQQTQSQPQGDQLSEDKLNSLLQKIASNIQNEKVQANMEEMVENALNNNILAQINVASQTSPHVGRPLKVHRHSEVNQCDIQRYETIYAKIKPTSTQMQKRVLEVLRDQRDGWVDHHKAYGRIVEAKQGYRLDGRFLANKKQPQDLPDMAIAVLVDQSGSMEGGRLSAAIEAAVMLDDFATGIDIPVMIVGHNTEHERAGSDLYMHTLFDRAGQKDKYRIAAMEAGGCNRDGMALNVVADMLAKRPEEIKMLIVISDGQPNADQYGGEEAEKDIKNIVAKAKSKGVQVFAAAIGSDKDRIQNIYGDGFLDVSDLSTLPKTMVRLISKRIL